MNTDHTAAVIEAARKLLKHVTIGAVETSFGHPVRRVSIRLGDMTDSALIAGRVEDRIDDVFGDFAGLSAAIEAYDESETP